MVVLIFWSFLGFVAWVLSVCVCLMCVLLMLVLCVPNGCLPMGYEFGFVLFARLWGGLICIVVITGVWLT